MFDKRQSYLITSFISIAILLSGAMYRLGTQQASEKIVYKNKIIYKDKIVYKTKTPDNVLLTISRDTLSDDIKKNYTEISPESKKIILDAIFKYSKEYDINPLIVYSLLSTESSFRYWIRHSVVNITVNKKKIKTRAIGIGAVIWEWWGDKLKEKGIARVKSDLYRIENNIHAACFVLSENMKMPLIKGTHTKEESAFLRYFGGGAANKWYVDRVNRVMSDIMKRELYKPKIEGK